MRLYFAGSGGGYPEERMVLEGCRNRLVTYVDMIDGPMSRDGRQISFMRGKRIESFWLTGDYKEHMRLYFAGNVKSRKGEKSADAVDHESGVRNRLLSYADVDDWGEDCFAYWIEALPANVNVFLDSGAFGAFTRGVKIDLDKYCAYVEEHRAHLACYACLDVIHDPVATARNLAIMRQRGLDPVPVFHSSGDPFTVLHALASDSKHLALGGMADAPSREKLQTHLDRCFGVLERHWPIRVHGFGVMAQWALERYPFYSVDSSSAIVGAGMGRVQRFERGLYGSTGWKDDVRRLLDGAVADGIGHAKSAHGGRRARNISAQLALERHVTSLWESRGVRWEQA